jgi:hypothetical protein
VYATIESRFADSSPVSDPNLQAADEEIGSVAPASRRWFSFPPFSEQIQNHRRDAGATDRTSFRAHRLTLSWLECR